MTFAINKLPLSPFAKSYYQSKLEFMEKTEFFVCKCHDVSHQLVLETLETEENEEHVVYGCFHIVHLEFWEKLKCAMKYIFGRKCKDGDFDALLLRHEDADRLEWFANYLDDSIPAPDKQTDPFHFTFLSTDNVYEVSFETFQDKLKDGSILTDSELSVCVWMKPGNLFYRLYRAAKYLSGYCSRYGDFDSFEFLPVDAAKIRSMAEGLRVG
jgi:hypothetical protein